MKKQLEELVELKYLIARWKHAKMSRQIPTEDGSPVRDIEREMWDSVEEPILELVQREAKEKAKE